MQLDREKEKGNTVREQKEVIMLYIRCLSSASMKRRKKERKDRHVKETKETDR